MREIENLASSFPKETSFGYFSKAVREIVESIMKEEYLLRKAENAGQKNEQ